MREHQRDGESAATQTVLEDAIAATRELESRALKAKARQHLQQRLRSGATAGLALAPCTVEDAPCRVADRLFVGGIGAARNLAALRSLAITHVVNASPIVPCFHAGCLRYRTVAVFDDAGEDIAQFFESTNRWIDKGRRKGGVLVHCYAGQSRSVALILAYLVACEDMSVDVALTAVRAQRPSAQPNAGFMRQLADYEASFRPTRGAAREDLVLVEPALTTDQAAGQTSGADCDFQPSDEAASAAPDAERHLKACKSGRECVSPACEPQDKHASQRPPFRQAVDENSVVGLAVDVPSASHVQKGGFDVWMEGSSLKKEQPWVTGASVSPEALCGAAFMVAHGGYDGEVDPAPSPQSSAGDCYSLQGTPARPAAIPSDWDIPAFSLDDGFSTPPGSAQRGTA